MCVQIRGGLVSVEVKEKSGSVRKEAQCGKEPQRIGRRHGVVCLLVCTCVRVTAVEYNKAINVVR